MLPCDRCFDAPTRHYLSLWHWNTIEFAIFGQRVSVLLQKQKSHLKVVFVEPGLKWAECRDTQTRVARRLSAAAPARPPVATAPRPPQLHLAQIFTETGRCLPRILGEIVGQKSGEKRATNSPPSATATCLRKSPSSTIYNFQFDEALVQLLDPYLF